MNAMAPFQLQHITKQPKLELDPAGEIETQLVRGPYAMARAKRLRIMELLLVRQRIPYYTLAPTQHYK